jgi:Protein of unknown function (DUF2470)
MSQGPSSSFAAGVQKVVKHLNGKHPDTVLFLARHAAGVSDAVEAELLAVDPDGTIEWPHPRIAQETARRTCCLSCIRVA